jgi:hypothetical protein
VLDLSAGPDGRPDTTEPLLGLHRHLLGMILEECRQADERQAELAGQVYELRQLNDQFRAATEALRGLVGRLQVPPCHLTQVLLPGGDVYQPGPGRTIISQPLPVGAAGLAGLDLCSPGRQDAGEGYLLVALRSGEAEAFLAGWTLPYEELGRGWFRCFLPQALTDSSRHLEVWLECNTARGTAPDLALADIGPWHEMSAAVRGKPLGKALAVITWGAVPGVKVGSAGLWLPEGRKEGDGALAYRLTAEDFLRVQPTAAADVEYFQLLCDTLGFRLHPVEGGVASALLPRGCLPGTQALVATAQVRSDQARFPVEYALCLTDVRAGCTTFPRAPEHDSRVVGFSGWQPVPPDRLPHAVTLTLERPLSVPADLHFATRMRPGQPVWYHWADWLGLAFRLGPVAPEVSPGREDGTPAVTGPRQRSEPIRRSA